MSMAREIYQQIIIDHGRKPRNFHELEAPCCSQTGHNRLCGDILRVHVRVENQQVVACSFTGNGCAISVASASLLTEVIRGQSVEAVSALFSDFHAALVEGKPFKAVTPAHDRLSVFLGVAEYPARVKCATLAWQTLMAILHNHASQDVAVSTE
jgi:nitrogen fixation NifU-like protein